MSLGLSKSDIMQKLAENEIELSEELVRLEAERIFNDNVGIYQLIDRENDRQLQEAILLIQQEKVQSSIQEYSTNTDQTTDDSQSKL